MTESIFDALVVALKLDPTEYNNELRKYQKSRKDVGDQDTKLDKEALTLQKKRAEAIGEVKKQTLGLFATIVGAAGVEKFITTQTTNLSAMGRAAAGMGASVADVSAFSNMIQRNGGDAKAATASLQTLTQAMAELKLTGRTGMLADGTLNFIGAADAKLSAIEVYKRFAKWAEGKDAKIVTLIGGRLGLDEASINEAMKGSAQVNKDLAESYKLGVPNEAQVKRVQALQTAFFKMRQAITADANALLYDVAPGLMEIFDAVGEGAAKFPKLTEAVIALGVALGGLKAASTLVTLARVLGLLPPAAVATAGGGVVATAMGAAGAVAAFGAGLVLDEHGRVSSLNAGENEQLAAQRKGGLDAKTAAYVRGNAAPPVKTTTVQERADAIAAQFRGLGWGEEETRGMVAAMRAEDPKLDPRARPINPKTGKALSTAEGLGQHLAARQKDFQKLFPGADFHKSTSEQQVVFIDWELRNTERKAGDSIRGKSAEGAAWNYITKFMRPGDGGTINDARIAAKLLHSTPDALSAASKTDIRIDAINVYTQAKDADGIADTLPDAIKRRGLVTQGNSGMR